MNWHALIDWQIGSFGGNPAVMVDVSESPEHGQYVESQIGSQGLRDSIRSFSCNSEGSETLAGAFKDGEVSFAFLDGKPTYEETMRLLGLFYKLVHFNSLMAGSGIDHPEVKRALDDFCKEKGVPWRVFSPGVWAIHHAHKMGQPGVKK